MKYGVLVSFTDGTDLEAPSGANIYWAGKDTYPRDGYEPTAEWLEYLQSSKTAFGKPVISGKTLDSTKKAPSTKSKK